MAGPAFAADKPVYDGDRLDPKTTPTSRSSLNLLWVVIGAVLVIFMQAGFALVETGFCRAKHAAHVVSTNFAIFGLGFVGVLPHRLPAHVRRLQLPGLFGLRQAVGDALDRLAGTGCSSGRAASR